MVNMKERKKQRKQKEEDKNYNFINFKHKQFNYSHT